MKIRTIAVVSLIVMISAGSFLPYSIPYLIFPTIIIFAISSFSFLKNSNIQAIYKTILLIGSITIIPFFVYQQNWKNSIKDREVFIIPKHYIGLIGVIFEHEQGTPKEYFTTNRKYKIPKNGILLSQFDQQNNLGTLMLSGNIQFIYEDEFYQQERTLIKDIQYSNNKYLSQVTTDSTLSFVNHIAHKKIRLKNGKEYNGVFYQIRKSKEKLIEWTEINGDLIDYMINE